MYPLSEKERRKMAYFRPDKSSYLHFSKDKKLTMTGHCYLGLDNVAKGMVTRTKLFGIRVTCLFWDIQLIVEPGMDVESVCQLYRAKYNERSRKHMKSSRAKIVARQSVEDYKKQNALVRGKIKIILEKENIEILPSKFDEFERFISMNSCFSDKDTIDFSLAWAVAMQQAIRQGKSIADVADDLAKEFDMGISGSMYTFSVAKLSQFWKYGQELEDWYQSKRSTR